MDHKEFLIAFSQKSGYDFVDYSESSIVRRLQKICADTGMDFEQILAKSATDKALVTKVVEDITVNTTELLRDPSVWVSTAKTVYPKLPKQAMSTIWHAGCSTGLEVYSDLIMLSELGISDRVRVIGTDINPTVLDSARRGVYSFAYNKAYVDNFDYVMSQMGLRADFDKYFDIDVKNDTITVKPELRAKASFLKQDLVKDKAPFPYRVDVVFLRNVIIYFNEALQMRVLKSISEKLFPGGTLILGKQEDLPLKAGTVFSRSGVFYKKK